MTHKRQRKRSIFDVMSDYVEDFKTWAEEMIESAANQRPSWDIESCSLEPLCNIFVTTKEVVVTADLPYAEPKMVRVEAIGEDMIEIEAKMKRKVHFDDFGITHRKGEFSSFLCQPRIPVPVKPEQMKISFKHGILEIRLPRKKGYEIKVE